MNNNKGRDHSRLGIGIDTGGTCTDSVIVDLVTGAVVAKAKELTTHDDLIKGIGDALGRFDFGMLQRAEYLALSTTLATNSIVEGRGARVGLIMAVPKPATFQVPDNLPCEKVAILAGAHNHRGEVVTPLDDSAVEVIESMAAEVDSFAISSYFSIYNNEHELAMKELVATRTGKPAICTHELSGAVGMVERAVTAVLNGRLLPVIDELLSAVETTLSDMGLSLPVLIVRGDGSLMAGHVARLRPVETVLSGPAASIAGACRLSGIESGMVVDMGGTTTDIAIVHDGQANVSTAGAVVGGWRTRVQAVDMWTLGLGGDSHIRCAGGEKVSIGPQRAVPFCLAATWYPQVVSLLNRVLALSPQQLKPDDTVFYTLRKRPAGQLHSQLAALITALDQKVRSLAEIRSSIGGFLDIEGLAAQGYLIQVGFTPTDLLHTTGERVFWNREAAEAGLRLLVASHRNIRSCMAMQKHIRSELDLRLAGSIATKALQEGSAVNDLWDASCEQLLDAILRGDNKAITIRMPLQLPLVAVGAPAHAHLPSAAEILSAIPVVPAHAEVANAYGAVTAKVMATATAVIRPASQGGYFVVMAEFQQEAVQLKAAVELAQEKISETARRLVQARGGEDVEVTVHREEILAPLDNGWGDPVLIEIRLTAVASGSPVVRSPEPWFSSAILQADPVWPPST